MGSTALNHSKWLESNENARRRIPTAKLLETLADCGLGKIRLTPNRIRSIEILLRKALPDFQNTQHITVDHAHQHLVRHITIEPVQAISAPGPVLIEGEIEQNSAHSQLLIEKVESEQQ